MKAHAEVTEMPCGCSRIATAFDRTYGALSDGLGLGPARRLQAAWQEMIAAGIAQHEARANYALLVQGAIAQGLQRLRARLADKADKGERIESVLALLRLAAVSTEEVVHIGTFVGATAQKILTPTLTNWFKARSKSGERATPADEGGKP